MSTLPADVLAAATAAVEARLDALDAYVLGDGPAPEGLPTSCCGECRSCEAGLAVAAAWPVLLDGFLARARLDGDIDAATVADWLERDLSLPAPSTD